jgi:hypothetical protein
MTRAQTSAPERTVVTPFFVASPYISAVSPLAAAFTHSDRGGRVPISPTFRRSDFSTCRLSSTTYRLSSTISRIFNSLPPLVPLFAPLFSLVSFIFSSLRTLFCTYRGWPHRCSTGTRQFSSLGSQTFRRSDLQTFRSPVPKSKLLTGGEAGKRRGIAPGAER